MNFISYDQVLTTSVLNILGQDEPFRGTYEELCQLVEEASVSYDIKTQFSKRSVRTCLDVFVSLGLLRRKQDVTSSDIEEEDEEEDYSETDSKTKKKIERESCVSIKVGNRVTKYLEMINDGQRKLQDIVIKCKLVLRKKNSKTGSKVVEEPDETEETPGGTSDKQEKILASLDHYIEQVTKQRKQQNEEKREREKQKGDDRRNAVKPKTSENTTTYTSLGGKISVRPSENGSSSSVGRFGTRISVPAPGRFSHGFGIKSDKLPVSRIRQARKFVTRVHEALAEEEKTPGVPAEQQPEEKKGPTGAVTGGPKELRTYSGSSMTPIVKLPNASSAFSSESGIYQAFGQSQPFDFSEIVVQFRVSHTETGERGSSIVSPVSRIRSSQSLQVDGDLSLDMPFWKVHDWLKEDKEPPNVDELYKLDQENLVSDQGYLERHEIALQEAKEEWEAHLEEKKRLKQIEKERRQQLQNSRSRSPRIGKRSSSGQIDPGSINIPTVESVTVEPKKETSCPDEDVWSY
mmetsp:Transcript_6782/g.15161  ORF Transcript_6782/g.15161 Transcript_6782/m.15161 type:complete len:518 (+) Transcript_6782:2755-4308(+)